MCVCVHMCGLAGRRWTAGICYSFSALPINIKDGHLIELKCQTFEKRVFWVYMGLQHIQMIGKYFKKVHFECLLFNFSIYIIQEI